MATSLTRTLRKCEFMRGSLHLRWARMVEKGVYLTPTLSCNGIMARKPYERFLTADVLQKGGFVMREGLKALKVKIHSLFGRTLLM